MKNWSMALVSLVVLAACGEDEGTDPFGGGGGSSGSDSMTAGSADSTRGSSPTGNDSDSTSGSTAATSEGSEESDGGSDGGIKLDVGSPTGGFGSCECELDYLWVADYEASTVAKINTKTLEIEAAYLTREDAAGNPSRTSVNLAGDVAVANRHGGLVKFYGDVADCQESNGIPGIQTSTGPNDVLPWNEEECRAWFVDIPTTNQRPVAWTAGDSTPGACDAANADVWTVGSAVPGLFPGQGGNGGVIAYLIDGQTGAIEEEVAVDGFSGSGFGAYGGAVDAAGNLFFSPLGTFSPGKLARVDKQSLAPTIWDIPQGVSPYGITVDHLGRVWLSSTIGSLAARFDPSTQTWDVLEGFGGGSGLAEGPDNWMYLSSGSTVRAVDLESMQVGGVWTTDESVKGVSFDAEGFLWAVTYRDTKDPMSEAAAYKIDVMTMTTEGVVPGLEDPYTYSDMTGNALGTVACAPAG